MITLEEAKKLRWGTYGKSGKDPLRVVTLDECTTEHLANIRINIEIRHLIDESEKEYIKAVDLILADRREHFDSELFEME